MKIYVEVEGGMVIGAYTDEKDMDIDFILCDHDDAEQETEGDSFNFIATEACNELDEIIDDLKCIF